MHDFWDNLTPEELQALEPQDLPFPGTRGITAKFRRKTRLSRRPLYRTAAAVAVVAALSLGVWAGYEQWHMPERGETYEGDSVQIHKENTYTQDPGSDPDTPALTSDTAPTDAQEIPPDSWFLEQAAAVLKLVDKEAVDQTRLTLTRQENQMWKREEVVVTFPENETSRSVKFDAKSGYLIGISAFDSERSGGDPMSEEEALAAAQGFYDALPYAKGYEFRSVEKFDDESWMYCFDRPIQVELWGQAQTVYSPYEEVRIIIDPTTGAFQDSNCFYVPLLDDHRPADVPLTQEEAREIAENLGIFAQAPDNYTVTATLTACLPAPEQVSWWLTGSMSSGNACYYDVTRLGWCFRFEGALDGFADSYSISIDLYTGEILSIDATR